ICCFVFPVSYYKTGYNIVACTNCLLLLLISISPYWLMHPEGEYVFSLGFWTKCYEHKCYIITDSTTISLLGILVITSEKLKYEFGDIILFLNWDFYLGCCVCALYIILGE
ncbi:hypothetical protein Chor_005327, partial [Crotalus horridus]